MLVVAVSVIKGGMTRHAELSGTEVKPAGYGLIFFKDIKLSYLEV